MPPALADTLSTLADRWAALPQRLRTLLIVAVAGAAVIGLGSYAASQLFVDYQILFSNLSTEDAEAVVDALREGRVPYRVATGGQVLVPASRVHEWRLRLASQGVPSGGNVGFEIFDKNQFGLTDFSQRLNFQRALQGELARTIGELREVAHARVHLALPAPRVFSAQDKSPSASVVLRLRPGAILRPDQVRGIVHLVTAAVEGLSPDRVTVIDSAGRVLASGLDRALGVSAAQQEARSVIEQETERRIQSLLDPIVGSGRSAVRVAALVNLDQIERTEERFDPKPLVRTQSKTSENTQGTSSQPTIVGANEQKADPTSATTKTQRETEQTTYEIARTVERTVVTPGDVRRLSVAVLLDVPLVNATRTPRTDEELERIKRLVASAAGIRADRKDELEVQQVPFDPTAIAPGEPAPQAAPAARPLRMPVSWTIGVAIAAAVLGLAVLLYWRVRRRQRALVGAVSAALANDVEEESEAHAHVSAPEVSGAPASIVPLDLKPKSDKDALRDRITAAAREHPGEMANVLRAWMVRRRPSTS